MFVKFYDGYLKNAKNGGVADSRSEILYDTDVTQPTESETVSYRLYFHDASLNSH